MPILLCLKNACLMSLNPLFALGSVPLHLKMAAATPILKKSGLHPTVLNNYQTISNPPVVAKLLEAVDAS